MSHPSTAGGPGTQDRGLERLRRWASEGVLATDEYLAEAWRTTPRQLAEWCDRGELFAVNVERHVLFVAELATLPQPAVASICRLQHAIPEGEQLVFWLRAHAGLDGRTVKDAIDAGEIDRARRLAIEWARERTRAPGAG